MFEYISKILLALTPGQRLWALSLLLLSIIAISLGPGYINRNNCEDLYPIVKEQKSEIASLNMEILQVQRECTENSVKREKEIRDLVGQLEIQLDLITKQQQSAKIYKQNYIRDTSIYGQDTVLSVVKAQVQTIPMDLSGMKKSIKCLKDKLGKTE